MCPPSGWCGQFLVSMGDAPPPDIIKVILKDHVVAVDVPAGVLVEFTSDSGENRPSILEDRS